MSFIFDHFWGNSLGIVFCFFQNFGQSYFFYCKCMHGTTLLKINITWTAELRLQPFFQVSGSSANLHTPHVPPVTFSTEKGLDGASTSVGTNCLIRAEVALLASRAKNPSFVSMTDHNMPLRIDAILHSWPNKPLFLIPSVDSVLERVRWHGLSLIMAALC